MTERIQDTAELAPDPGAPESSERQAVMAWRRGARRRFIEQRQQLGREERPALRDAIIERLDRDVRELADHTTVGFYWPIQGEPDLRRFMARLVENGATAALPVVVTKREPVEFWRWQPRMRMQTGPDAIPHPPERDPVRPTALLIPLVGFDEGGYRLGYGAGYYDRSLAALDPKPLCVGIGLELGRLASIYPQSHDVPLDVIVTEAATLDLRS